MDQQLLQHCPPSTVRESKWKLVTKKNDQTPNKQDKDTIV